MNEPSHERQNKDETDCDTPGDDCIAVIGFGVLKMGEMSVAGRAKSAGVGNFVATIAAGGNWAVFFILREGKDDHYNAKWDTNDPRNEKHEHNADEDEEQAKTAAAADVHISSDAGGIHCESLRKAFRTSIRNHHYKKSRSD